MDGLGDDAGYHDRGVMAKSQEVYSAGEEWSGLLARAVKPYSKPSQIDKKQTLETTKLESLQIKHIPLKPVISRHGKPLLKRFDDFKKR